MSFPHSVIVFKDGANVETAKEFVHFLVAEGWLMHYLDFSGERAPDAPDGAHRPRPEAADVEAGAGAHSIRASARTPRRNGSARSRSCTPRSDS